MDALLVYLSNHFDDRLSVSGVTGDLLIWGERVNDDVRLLGLSFNVSTAVTTTQGHGDRLISSGTLFSQQTNLPLVKIVYSPDLQNNPKSTLLLDGEEVKRDEAANKIQAKFGTHYKLFGTNKAVNRATNDAFQDWARDNLPRNYVRIDIDAILDTQEQVPVVLIEVKRSPKVPTQSWKPYIDDIRNYYISDLLAKQTHLNFVTLNHAFVTSQVLDTSMVGIHDIQKVSLTTQEIQSTKVITNAKSVIARLDSLS